MIGHSCFFADDVCSFDAVVALAFKRVKLQDHVLDRLKQPEVGSLSPEREGRIRTSTNIGICLYSFKVDGRRGQFSPFFNLPTVSFQYDGFRHGVARRSQMFSSSDK